MGQERSLHWNSQRDQQDGFSLVELLIVIVILGVLATVTVFAVRGITDKGQTSACNTDRTTVDGAAEAYFAQYGGTAIASTSTTVPTGVPAAANVVVATPAVATWTAGVNPGATLVAARLLRSVPTLYFVGTDGTLYVADAKCGTVGASVA